jgi:hypothetical protein
MWQPVVGVGKGSVAGGGSEQDKRLEEAECLLRQVLSELPSFDAVVPALLCGGVPEARRRCKLTPGAHFYVWGVSGAGQ